jgi:20S proteasome alpha/beta subunit
MENPTQTGGFDFSNFARNKLFQSKGIREPKAISTGTTICAIIYKDGVILGADTRATEGHIVADKNCFKIHYLTPTIYCCGAGTAADCDFVTSNLLIRNHE